MNEAAGSSNFETVSTSDMHSDRRRVLRFNSPQELTADLDSLRAGPVRGIKNWSLPQACWHVAGIVEQNLKPADTTERSPEQEAKKVKFFAMVLGPQGMPENLPLPPQFDPPADCGLEQIDRLLAAFKTFQELPHSHLVVGSCGAVATKELLPLHLAHAAHHLSFIKRADRRKNLRYANIDELISDVRLLERGYVQIGNWSLQQMCWHLNGATSYFISNGPHNAVNAPPDGPQKLNAVLASGQIPDGIPAPPHMLPPAECEAAEVEKYLATLQRAKAFNGPFPPHRLFGPITAEQGHRLILMHAARHLSFLVPTTTVVPVQ